MTYYVNVTNETRYDMPTSDDKTIPAAGGKWQSGLIGDAWIQTVVWGTLNFMDIAHAHVGGDGPGEWGVLVSYQGEEVVARYDGSPVLEVVISAMGEANLSGAHFSIRQVSLPAFQINLPPQTTEVTGDSAPASEAEAGELPGAG